MVRIVNGVDRKKGQHLTPEERQAIVRLRSTTAMTNEAIAQIFQCKEVTVRNVLKLWQTKGLMAPVPRVCHPRKVTEAVKIAVQNRVTENISTTLGEIVKAVKKTTRVKLTQRHISRVLVWLHLSRKVLRHEVSRMNVQVNIDKRRDYVAWFRDLHFNQRIGLDRFIFVDEAGFNACMTRTTGLSPVGERAIKVVPQIRGKNLSVIGAMNCNRMVTYMFNSGGTKAVTFIAFLKQLIAALDNGGSFPRPCIIIADNATIHKTEAVKQCVAESRHQLCYLSPYSPFLNPIEMAWSKAKRQFRMKNEGIEDQMKDIIRDSFRTIIAKDCKSWCMKTFSYHEDCLASLPIHSKS